MLKVRSFNILAPHLANAKIFPRCDGRYLGEAYRLLIIKENLKKAIKEKAIVCIQEMNELWQLELSSFFESHGYELNHTIYYKKGQDSMGVAIAFPSTEYTQDFLDISCLPDTRLWELKAPWRKYAETRFASISKSKKCSWNAAAKKVNQMVTVRLSAKDGSIPPFVIGTYHVPCAFKDPPLMLIHSSLCAEHIQRVANKLPFVLAGDFNFRPKSEPYMLLTKGSYKPKTNDKWKFNVKAMGSAYADHNGKEPLFTNLPGSMQPFKATLDYIFYSTERLEIKATTPLKANITAVMPNRDEGSDHLLIGADFLIKE